MSTTIFSRFNFATSSRERGLAFANRYFAGCCAHIDEAAGAHRALELLSREQLSDLDPDSSIREVLERGTPPADSLDTVEFGMKLEEEIGASIPSSDDAIWESLLLRVLLGPSAMRTTWDSATLPARSVRGVIDERVRLRSGCACGQRAV